MSTDDVDAERGHAGQTWAATGLPLFGLTLAGDGSWSARAWERTGRHIYSRADCDRDADGYTGETLSVWDAADIWLSKGQDEDYRFGYTEEELRRAAAET